MSSLSLHVLLFLQSFIASPSDPWEVTLIDFSSIVIAKKPKKN